VRLASPYRSKIKNEGLSPVKKEKHCPGKASLTALGSGKP
jgi:hypothetical protein